MFQWPMRNLMETYLYSEKVTETARLVTHAELKSRLPRTISGVLLSAIGCYRVGCEREKLSPHARSGQGGRRSWRGS